MVTKIRNPEIKGSDIPRIYTRPLRKVKRYDLCSPKCKGCPKYTNGISVIMWARRMGIYLHPWQRWLLIHSLEKFSEDGPYRFRICITLVARQNGKTLAKRVLSMYRLHHNNARLVVGVAQDLSQAREVMEEMAFFMEDHPNLSKRYNPDIKIGVHHKTNGNEFIRLDSKKGPRYLIKALNRSAGRGLAGVEELNIDELREQRDFLAWSAVSKIVMAQPNAQIWCMSNAGDAKSIVLTHLRASAISGADDSIFIAEWSAPKNCALDDMEAWAQANPQLEHSLPDGTVPMTTRAIRSALGTDPPNVFRTEVLCQFVDALDSAVDMNAWRAGADPVGTLDEVPQNRLCMVVEVSNDATHVTAAVAAGMPDGRVRVEIAGSWDSTQAARRELPDLIAMISPRVLGWFPNGPTAALSATLRKIKGSKCEEIKGQGASEASMTLAAMVKDRLILQPDDQLLDVQMSRSTKVGGRNAWMFDRSDQIDAVYAVAGAVYLASNLPDAPKRSSLVIVPKDE